MIRGRFIPVLLMRGTGIVKTMKFGGGTYLGDVLNAVAIFNDKMADDLIVLDIDASKQGRGPNFDVIRELASEAFMPVCYGGGIRTLDDAQRIFACGIEKISVNTALFETPEIVQECASRYGAQAVVAAIDVRKQADGSYWAVSMGRSTHAPVPLADMLKRAEDAGAGEILIQSVERDGTQSGYDHDLIGLATRTVTVPVVAAGGAASIGDMASAIVNSGASGAAAGSLFVFFGRQRAVLINMPTIAERDAALASVSQFAAAQQNTGALNA